MPAWRTHLGFECGIVIKWDWVETSALQDRLNLSGLTASSGCHGRSHNVSWASSPDCRSVPNTAVGRTLIANVLVLRHGIDLSEFGSDPTPATRRQVLPYAAPVEG
jgi:hypothetical protein